MNRHEFSMSFVERYSWNLVENGRGDFAVSPDIGNIKRVFFSDLKIRKSGTMLLGVIGIIIELNQYFLKPTAELSTYVTNIDTLSRPPIITNKYSLDDWIDRIVYSVYLLPNTMDKLIYQIELGVLGKFPLNKFINSSPDYQTILSYINEFR